MCVCGIFQNLRGVDVLITKSLKHFKIKILIPKCRGIIFCNFSSFIIIYLRVVIKLQVIKFSTPKLTKGYDFLIQLFS